MTPTTLEAALQAWVVAGTGLSANQVRWSQQDAPQTRPMVTLQMSVARTGQDWLDVVDNPTPTAGAEILHKARGTRKATLSIQAFSADAVGASGARALLERLVSRAKLPSMTALLDAVNAGLAPLGEVTTIDGVVGSTRFDPRAMLEASFFLVSEVSESGTYIETVEVTNLTTTDEFTIP